MFYLLQINQIAYYDQCPFMRFVGFAAKPMKTGDMNRHKQLKSLTQNYHLHNVLNNYIVLLTEKIKHKNETSFDPLLF
jgi:hypothetical protein